jgi:hypothetical protein
MSLAPKLADKIVRDAMSVDDAMKRVWDVLANVNDNLSDRDLTFALAHLVVVSKKEGAEEARQRIMDDCADALFRANKPYLKAMLEMLKVKR